MARNKGKNGQQKGPQDKSTVGSYSFAGPQAYSAYQLEKADALAKEKLSALKEGMEKKNSALTDHENNIKAIFERPDIKGYLKDYSPTDKTLEERIEEAQEKCEKEIESYKKAAENPLISARQQREFLSSAAILEETCDNIDSSRKKAERRRIRSFQAALDALRAYLKGLKDLTMPPDIYSGEEVAKLVEEIYRLQGLFYTWKEKKAEEILQRYEESVKDISNC